MQECQNPWSALDIRYSSISNPFLLNLLAASHKRDAVLGQIALDQIQVTGGKGNKAAIGIVANKDNGTGQIPLASQCDDLTRVVTESQRHIVADAVAGICFIEAGQITANVRQWSDGQFNLRGNHGGVNFIIAELPSLTGDVIYPIAALKGDSTTSDELEAAKEFIAYLQTDEAMSVFEKYHFSVNK